MNPEELKLWMAVLNLEQRGIKLEFVSVGGKLEDMMYGESCKTLRLAVFLANTRYVRIHILSYYLFDAYEFPAFW